MDAASLMRHASFSLCSTSLTFPDLSSKLKYLKVEKGVEFPEHKNRLELAKFADLLLENIDLGDEELGEFQPYEVPIPTTGESRSQKKHPIPHAFRDKVSSEVESMLQKGVIEYCNDPKGFHSPIQCVKKKDGSMRFCINFKRTLNRVLKDADPYQMPSTESCFQKVGRGNRYFSCLDLKSGYWQLKIQERDRNKTSF